MNSKAYGVDMVSKAISKNPYNHQLGFFFFLLFTIDVVSLCIIKSSFAFVFKCVLMCVMGIAGCVNNGFDFCRKTARNTDTQKAIEAL